jgi:hypothetical protein
MEHFEYLPESVGRAVEEPISWISNWRRGRPHHRFGDRQAFTAEGCRLMLSARWAEQLMEAEAACRAIRRGQGSVDFDTERWAPKFVPDASQSLRP